MKNENLSHDADASQHIDKFMRILRLAPRADVHERRGVNECMWVADND